MSYILDALKKAEQERDIGRVPRLESVQDPAPRRARGVAWWLAGALLVNAAVLALWLRPSAPPGLARTAPASTAMPATPAPRAIARVTPAPVATPTPVRAAAIASSTQSRPAPAAPRPAALPQPALPAALPRPEAASAPTPAAQAAPVPLLHDLPDAFRASVPPLSVDVHVYAPSPNGRFVLINMKKYHEGEQLAEGPRLEEITADGVVLSYQGERFRIARPSH